MDAFNISSLDTLDLFWPGSVVKQCFKTNPCIVEICSRLAQKDRALIETFDYYGISSWTSPWLHQTAKTSLFQKLVRSNGCLWGFQIFNLFCWYPRWSQQMFHENQMIPPGWVVSPYAWLRHWIGRLCRLEAEKHLVMLGGQWYSRYSVTIYNYNHSVLSDITYHLPHTYLTSWEPNISFGCWGSD